MQGVVEQMQCGSSYKRGCRCEPCKAKKRATYRNAERVPGVAVNTFQFACTCANCGGPVEQLATTSPRDGLVSRSTSTVRCLKAGCQRTWLLTVLIQPASNER